MVRIYGKKTKKTHHLKLTPGGYALKDAHCDSCNSCRGESKFTCKGGKMGRKVILEGIGKRGMAEGEVKVRKKIK